MQIICETYYQIWKHNYHWLRKRIFASISSFLQKVMTSKGTQLYVKGHNSSSAISTWRKIVIFPPSRRTWMADSAISAKEVAPMYNIHTLPFPQYSSDLFTPQTSKEGHFLPKEKNIRTFSSTNKNCGKWSITSVIL